MPRSDPHLSSIVARVRQSNSQLPQVAAHSPTLGRKLSIRFAKLARWLHIYLSMFGLAAVLFFSATGITLNHPSWTLGQIERKREVKGEMALSWVRHEGSPSESTASSASDQAQQVAKLDVVEYLRKTHAIRAPSRNFASKTVSASFRSKVRAIPRTRS